MIVLFYKGKAGGIFSHSDCRGFVKGLTQHCWHVEYTEMLKELRETLYADFMVYSWGVRTS